MYGHSKALANSFQDNLLLFGVGDAKNIHMETIGSTERSKKCQRNYSNILFDLTRPTMTLLDTVAFAFCGGASSVGEVVSPSCYVVKGNDVINEGIEIFS